MARKILLVGESWSSIGFHLKGFSIYTTGNYEEGGRPLIEALESQGYTVDYIPNHAVPGQFPTEVAKLRQYDCVILSDVGADTFLLHPDTLYRSRIRPNTLRVIADYVREGGGFLMVGGYMSFSGFSGHAMYHNTVIAEVLPVDMLGHDDRIELPEGMHPTVVAEHPAVAELDRTWPPFLGYQRLVAKPGSTTVMTAGNDPFLVLGNYGKGRTAAFASDCSPHWGTPQFVEWDQYARFWGQLVDWLGVNGAARASGASNAQEKLTN